MRLWTLHPKYLDAKGLVALWREALLAQKTLRGLTKGYRYHPQLTRFKAVSNSVGAVAAYLSAVHEEAVRRGYRFDGAKIGRVRFRGQIAETEGQLRYEWAHLLKKLAVRDRKQWLQLKDVPALQAHPLFRIVSGSVRAWEKR